MALVMSNCLKISELAERWLLIGIPNFERLGLGNEFGYFCNAPDQLKKASYYQFFVILKSIWPSVCHVTHPTDKICGSKKPSNQLLFTYAMQTIREVSYEIIERRRCTCVSQNSTILKVCIFLKLKRTPEVKSKIKQRLY